MGIHIVKRNNISPMKKAGYYVGAIFIALFLGACVLWAMGVNPFEYYYQMFTMDMVGNRIAYKTLMNYIKELIPLILTSIALSLTFKMKFWNIGAEGQFIMGAIAASAVGLKLGTTLPIGVTLLLICLSAMLAAGIYGLFVGILKVKFGTNETLLTLMLNYIALYFLKFIGEKKEEWNFFLQEESLRPVFQSFDELLAFPSILIGKNFKLSICVILTIVIGILTYVYLKHTKQGYEISVIGDSVGTAHYAGMKVKRIILRTVFLSSAMIGLAAAFKVGSTGELSTSITDDVGWTAIVVAWLAQLNTGMIFVVSGLICVLQFGSTVAAAEFVQVDSSFANMLQGVILFLVLAADFFIRFRIARTKKGEKIDG